MTLKEELEEFLADKPKVLCAKIRYQIWDGGKVSDGIIVMTIGHTDEDYRNLLRTPLAPISWLHPDSIIWFTDGSWAEYVLVLGRWASRTVPSVPDELKG